MVKYNFPVFPISLLILKMCNSVYPPFQILQNTYLLLDSFRTLLERCAEGAHTADDMKSICGKVNG